MRRDLRKRLLHRLGQLLESDLDTEGLWDEVDEVDAASLDEVRDFVLREADKFFRRSDAIAPASERKEEGKT